MKEYLKKNWKSITLVIAIALLILVNVRQYRTSLSIQRENEKINIEYAALKQRDSIYNQQIAQYKSDIEKKDSQISTSKQKITKTDSLLAISQGDVKRLSKKILNQNTSDPDDLKAYVATCDSLATVAPILSDQVDTLKSQNQQLVTTMEEKSAIQDSIITKKDAIISEKDVFLDKTMDSYNKSVAKLTLTEDKLAKEKKRKGFWKKVALGLGLGIIGVIATK